MVFINLGFPKTSSTNLQTYFYPNLKGLNYLGRFNKNDPRYHRDKNRILFNELHQFIENRKYFSNSDVDKLIKDFSECHRKYRKILISKEGWLNSYQKNYSIDKWEIVNQETKLKNLLFILNKSGVEYKFFFIKRDLKTSISSLFVMQRERIHHLFGEKFLSFEYFLNYIHKKKANYESLLLLLDVYNLKKITKLIPYDKIKIFEYNDIQYNKKKFVEDISNYLDIKTDYNLIDALYKKTKITNKSKTGEYEFQTKNKLSIFLKSFIPTNLINKFRYLLKFNIIKFFLYKKFELKKNNIVLEKIIKEYF